MFRVIKVLNNNAILATDGSDNEIVFLGKGIGFNRKIDDLFDNIENSKCYCLQKETEKGNSLDLIDNMKPLYLEIASEILNIAEKRFKKIDNSVLVTLADHIAFSIERLKKDLVVNNPFSDDIKSLFKDEYEVALKGKEIIKRRTGAEISNDEVGYITLHIHSALTSDNVSQSMRIAMIIRETIEKVEDKFNIEIKTDSLSYSRLMNHVKFMIVRLKQNEKLHVDINEYTKTQFPNSYDIALNICDKIAHELKQPVDEVEVGYLALHIERIKTSEIK
ncbi:MAG: PRD domain-containing protein [Inconstantimicrobium porci]|uniref:PRD domain-containing protein n=1 Tax=Inconstantimicrobium porci TaxID=2652291 RepID=A0A7X2MXS9_9CLOT|nr:PRD domain-containing protein [Inconstantimicrobium porci]MDD6769410.1 PRD domain-containing protein [Inconstantimicrobium porci]MDY5913293.1 PRD domain-containing protein [Inconstantimicrobium porci]MSR91039.1 PRD domain-containing protein [Inconstantimicrobium porci]